MTLFSVISFTFLPSDWLSNQLSAEGGLYVPRVGFSTRMGADYIDNRSTVIYIWIWSATETTNRLLQGSDVSSPKAGPHPPL